MKKIYLLLLGLLLTLNVFSQNILTLTSEDATSYKINGTVTGDVLVASEASDLIVRLYNYTQKTSNDYTTKSNFTDFSIDGVNPTSVEDAIRKINSITNLVAIKSNASTLVNQTNVAYTLGAEINSSKVYIIDGVVDLAGISVEIPAGGLSMIGYTFDISKLTSSEPNYTMFTSPLGGSGNLLAIDMAIEVTGTSSKAFDLISSSGGEAFEFTRVNFNNCSSLGVIDNYRQGLETGTGRFGGTPELELKGLWSGGYFIDTSIIRGLDDGAYSIYKAGAGFVMASRFRTNQNIDLPANTSFIDFSPSNFVNPSTFDLDGCRITRNGISNPEDTNIIPNILKGDLASLWKGNQGIKNTFVGGKMSVILESATTISNTVDFVDLNATYLPSDLQHFVEDVSGRLKHLGSNPREFRVFFDGIIDGGSNNVLILKLVKWDDSDSLFSDIGIQVRQVNSLVGSRDVAFFNYVTTVELDKDDYIKWQIRNTTSTTNLTYELDGSWVIEAR